MIKKKQENLEHHFLVNPITSIHHYRGRLLFGDANRILTEMKSGDAYFKSFYDEKKGNFINEIENLKAKQKVEYFTLPYSGGAYHHLFYLEPSNKYKNKCLGFYIDTASAHFVHEQGTSKDFYSKNHAKLLAKIILTITRKTKPFASFICKSKSILATECGDKVKFVSNEQPELEHTKLSVKEAKDRLIELCFEPKCSFINFRGTDKDKQSYDFYIEDLDNPMDDSFDIFKLDLKHINSPKAANSFFTTYYAQNYLGENNPNEKKISPKDEKKAQRIAQMWFESELSKFGMSPDKLGMDFTKPTQTSSEVIANYIKEYGAVMGYFFIPKKFTKILKE